MAGKLPTPNELVNGPLYKTAHFATAYLNVPPNKHRLFNAVGVTVGIVAGRQLMQILTGSTLSGKKIDKEDVPLPLRPLHGVLAYDHFSDDPKDRWMKVFDMMVPAALGGFGAGVGSDMFFKKDFLNPVQAKMGAEAEKFLLADAEKQALFHASKPWSLKSMTAAVFGSASGFGLFPSFLNYSSTLGTKFTVQAERTMVAPWLGKDLQATLLNTHSSLPFRPTKAIGVLVQQLSHNPEMLSPKNVEETATGILKTWFRHIKTEQIETFTDRILAERKAFVESKGQKTIEGIEKEIEKHMKDWLGLDNKNFEKRLIESGIDPREVSLGDMGFISTLSRWCGDSIGFGTSKKLKATQDLLIEGLEKRHPELAGKAFEKAQFSSSTVSKVAATGFVGAGLGTLYAISSAKDSQMDDLGFLSSSTLGDRKKKPESFTERVTESSGSSTLADAPLRKHKVHNKRDATLSERTLDAAEGITSMLNAAIGMHRIHCAVGLWLGSWFGDEVMKAMTATTFQGKRVTKEEVWKPLQKIYNTLPFNPQSDLPHDKWMQVLRWGVPAIVGTMTVVQGSKAFFSERSEKLKKAKYLDEIEDKVSMAQSKPWSYTSAVSGLFGFPTGLPMVPLANYSTNLGTRFSMGAGRKVSLPIVGKIWSNNPTLFPFGPPGMLNLMIKEAVNNKNFDPSLLETYAIGVLKPWFSGVTPEQIEAFVMEVHKVRDKFYQEGGVPENMKAQLETELKAHLKGAGLEETLTEIGLDPLRANIGSNGLSGAIANALGARSSVEKIKAEYAASYQERIKNKRENTSSSPHLSA